MAGNRLRNIDSSGGYIGIIRGHMHTRRSIFSSLAAALGFSSSVAISDPSGVKIRQVVGMIHGEPIKAIENRLCDEDRERLDRLTAALNSSPSFPARVSVRSIDAMDFNKNADVIAGALQRELKKINRA